MLALSVVTGSATADADQGSGAPADESLVTVPVTTFELADPGLAVAPPLSVAVIPRAGAVLTNAAVVAVDGVSFGARPEPQLIAGFSASLAHTGTRWRIEISPPFDLLDRVGNYGVTLIVPGTRADKAVEQRIVLQLERPEAQLELRPSRLVIERAWLFGWGEPSPSTIDIEELTRLRRVELDARDTRDAKTGTRTATGYVAIAPGKLGAGESKSFGVTLQGALSSGVTTGELSIRAPQINRPVKLPYEIRSRFHDIVVGLALLLGLGLGYLVRTGLVRLGERARLRGEVDRVALAASEAAASRDKVLSEEAASIARKCADGRRGSVEALLKLHQEQKAALELALTSLAARRLAVETRLAAIDSPVTAVWLLPPAARPALAGLAKELVSTRTLLDAGDAQAATDTLTFAEKQAFAMFQTAIAGWREALVQLDAGLTASFAATPWPRPASEVLIAMLGQLKALREALSDQAAGDAAGFAAALQAAHAVMEELRAGAGRTEATFHAVLSALAVQLETLRATREEIAALFDEETDRALADPHAYLQRLVERAPRLTDALEAVLFRLAPTARDEIRKQMRNGAWFDAVDTARTAIEAKPAPGLVAKDGGLTELSHGFAPLRDDLVTRVPPPSATPREPRHQDEIKLNIARAERQARWAKVAVSLISAGLLTLIYVVYFSSQAITTPVALFAVFFQAFTIDVTVAAVVTTAGQLLPKPAQVT